MNQKKVSIKPKPRTKVKLEYASNVTGDPTGGIKAFLRRAQHWLKVKTVK